MNVSQRERETMMMMMAYDEVRKGTFRRWKTTDGERIHPVHSPMCPLDESPDVLLFFGAFDFSDPMSEHFGRRWKMPFLIPVVDFLFYFEL